MRVFGTKVNNTGAASDSSASSLEGKAGAMDWSTIVIIVVCILNVALAVFILYMCRKVYRRGKGGKPNRQDASRTTSQQSAESETSSAAGLLNGRHATSPASSIDKKSQMTLDSERQHGKLKRTISTGSVATTVKKSLKRAFSGKMDNAVFSVPTPTGSVEVNFNPNPNTPFCPPENNRWSLMIAGAHSLADAPSQSYLDIEWHADDSEEDTWRHSAAIIANPYCTLPRAQRTQPKPEFGPEENESYLNLQLVPGSGAMPSSRRPSVPNVFSRNNSKQMDNDGLDARFARAPPADNRLVKLRGSAPDFYGKSRRSRSADSARHSRYGDRPRRQTVDTSNDVIDDHTDYHDDATCAMPSHVPGSQHAPAVNQYANWTALHHNPLQATVLTSSLESISTPHAKSEVLPRPAAFIHHRMRLLSAPTSPQRCVVRPDNVMCRSLSNLMLYNTSEQSSLAVAEDSVSVRMSPGSQIMLQGSNDTTFSTVVMSTSNEDVATGADAYLGPQDELPVPSEGGTFRQASGGPLSSAPPRIYLCASTPPDDNPLELISSSYICRSVDTSF